MAAQQNPTAPLALTGGEMTAMFAAAEGRARQLVANDEMATGGRLTIGLIARTGRLIDAYLAGVEGATDFAAVAHAAALALDNAAEVAALRAQKAYKAGQAGAMFAF